MFVDDVVGMGSECFAALEAIALFGTQGTSINEVFNRLDRAIALDPEFAKAYEFKAMTSESCSVTPERSWREQRIRRPGTNHRRGVRHMGFLLSLAPVCLKNQTAKGGSRPDIADVHRPFQFIAAYTFDRRKSGRKLEI